MDTPIKQILVCYIELNKILLYQDSTGSIIEVGFPQDVISDQEIVNKDKIENTIESALKEHKLEKGDAMFIFAPNLTIEKEFPEETTKEKENDIQKFVDIIPFEDVLSRSYSLNKKIKVVGINRELYDMIKNIFERQNLTVLGVIPSTVLQETVTELSKNFDLSIVASKIYDLKQYSVIDTNEPNNSNQAASGKPILKKGIKKYVIVAAPIAILFLLIFILLITNLFKGPSEAQPASLALPTKVPSPFPLPSVEPTPEETKPIFISSPSAGLDGI